MNRKLDWQASFAALVASRATVPFAWGTHDCCVWAADAVKAVTGVDFAENFRGTYTDEESAAVVLAQFEEVDQLATTYLGEPTTVSFATVGDIILFDFNNGYTLGVCNGRNSLVAGETGLRAVPTRMGLKAWKV